MKVIILVFVSLVLVYADDVDILCTTAYCEEYVEENTCVDIPTKCSIQNATHNGIFLPFAGPCNCCDYCVSNLDEGDACAIGDSASPTPAIICGDLLYCAASGDENTCQTIVTDCTKEQKQYDSKRADGTLGHLELRANCNRRGLYDPYKCIPGEICYCVSEEGERIFGEIPFTILAGSIMNCECSRKYEKASAFLGKPLYSGQYLRCSSNGDYDALQCVDDNCFCVHPSDGSLAINRETSVNITSISNETVSCFNEDAHIEGEYYRKCEAQVVEILQQIEEYNELGYEVFGYSFPNCQLDGYYAAVQQNDTFMYCADPDGNVIEDFIIPVDDEFATDMDCKCARSRNIGVVDNPECCYNGNYNPVQCRRGLCRCVDADGNQIAPQEVNFNVMDSLPCFQTGCANITVIETTDSPSTTLDADNEQIRFSDFADYS